MASTAYCAWWSPHASMTALRQKACPRGTSRNSACRLGGRRATDGPRCGGADSVVEIAELPNRRLELCGGDGLRRGWFLRVHAACGGPATKDAEDTNDQTRTRISLRPSCPLW